MPKGPDAIGPWAAAFQIAGADPAIDMFALPTYSVALGVMLSPLVLLMEDPRSRYQAAVALCGAMAVLSGWLCTRFLRRLIPADPLELALGFAVTIGLTAVAFSISFTWVEPLAMFWLFGWVVLATRAITKWSSLTLLLSSIWTGVSLAVHGRFALAPLVWVGFCAVVLTLDLRSGTRAKRDAIRNALLVLVVTGATTVATFLFRAAVTAAAWSAASTQSDTSILRNLVHIRFYSAFVMECFGQLWYITVSTAGLAPVGIYVLIHVARRAESGSAARRVAAFTLAGLGSVLAISVAFICDAWFDLPLRRGDYIVYGRYSEPVTVLLAAVGIAWLAKANGKESLRLFLGTALVMAASTVAALVIRWRYWRPSIEVLDGVISGVAAWPFDRPGLDLTRWTLTGLMAMCALFAARQFGRTPFAFVAVILLAAGTISGSVFAVSEHRAWDNSVLYVNYPRPTTGATRAVIAADALLPTSFKYGSPTQQYALAPLGWSFDSVPKSSAELARSVDQDVGMVVLLAAAGAPSTQWCHQAPFFDVLIWTRTMDTQDVGGGACGAAP